MNRKAFTLAELLVTVVIIAILASIATPFYVKTVEKGKQAEAYQILGEIRSALMRYYYENNEDFTTNWNDLYISDPTANAKYFDFYLGAGSGGMGEIARARRKDNIPWLGGQYHMIIYKNGQIDIVKGKGY